MCLDNMKGLCKTLMARHKNVKFYNRQGSLFVDVISYRYLVTDNNNYFLTSILT